MSAALHECPQESSPMHTVQMTTEYKDVTIQRLFNCVTQTSLLCKHAKLVSRSADEIIIERVQDINDVVSDILKSSNKIPYIQKINVDIKHNGRFLVSTTVSISNYRLDVGLLYKNNADNSSCVCHAKMKLYGVKDKLIKKIAVALIKAENKKCRRHEKDLLRLNKY